MRISVAMCTYKGERFLEEQLRSIFEQTRKPDEIVLLDDCSPDGTAALAEKILSECGIPHSILVNETNRGVFYSFQKCILACSGDVIFTADQDDVWRKDKIELMMREYEKDSSCMMVFSNSELVDGELNSLGCDFWTSLNLRRAGLCDRIPQEKFRQLLMYYWAVPGTQMSFRRELAEKAFPIPEKKGWLHDSWLAVCAPAYGTVTALDEPLTLYRQHGKNTVGARANKRDRKEEDICQVQKVLFYLKRHGDRLQNLLDVKGSEMPADYKAQVQKYVALFRSMEHYENDGRFKKMLFLLGRFFDGRLGAFDISRGNVLRYLFYQVSGK
ncbi:MAG: glycosyltransferase family 2 protein [Lachnospiraceae bacterium]|nr:glycosyltransferase family 2 protein [Lachnospiraceae bacterium]